MKDLGLGEYIERGRGNYKESIHRGRSMARKRMKNNDGDAMDVDGDSGSLASLETDRRAMFEDQQETRVALDPLRFIELLTTLC